MKALKVLGELIPPLPGPHRIRRRQRTVGAQVVNVLLPLDDEHDPLGHGVGQFGQTVGHQADALEVPRPTAVAVRPPLAESLLRAVVARLQAHGLEQHRPALVAIVVRCNRLWLAVGAGLRGGCGQGATAFSPAT